MLPEIAAEMLHFLSRRDLDKASGVSKWLDAMIAQCCAVYPLRPVLVVKLYPMDAKLNVSVEDDEDLLYHLFDTLDKAVHFTGTILRHSYIECLKVGGCDYHSRGITFLPGHWTTLIKAIRSGAVRSLYFGGIDFRALKDDSFLAAMGCRGIHSLAVLQSVIRSRFVTDDLIRSSVAQGLHHLCIFDNNSDTPPAFSEDAVMDFFFRADAEPGRQPLSLEIESTGVTDMFLARFLGRFQSSPARPCGTLRFYGGTPKQRGLSAYDQYLAQDDDDDEVDATYRFPSMDDDTKYGEVQLTEDDGCFYVDCHASQ